MSQSNFEIRLFLCLIYSCISAGGLTVNVLTIDTCDTKRNLISMILQEVRNSHLYTACSCCHEVRLTKSWFMVRLSQRQIILISIPLISPSCLICILLCLLWEVFLLFLKKKPKRHHGRTKTPGARGEYFALQCLLCRVNKVSIVVSAHKSTPPTKQTMRCDWKVHLTALDVMQRTGHCSTP